MTRKGLVLLLLVTTCLCFSVPSSAVICYGEPDQYDFTNYYSWAMNSYLSGGMSMSDMVDFYEYFDQTVTYGDCPATCPTFVDNTITFTGGNQLVSNVFTNPMVAGKMGLSTDGTLVMASTNEALYVHDATTDAWQPLDGGGTNGNIAIADYDHIYVINQDGNLSVHRSSGWNWLGTFPGVHNVATMSSNPAVPTPNLYALSGQALPVKFNSGGWWDALSTTGIPAGGFSQLTAGYIEYLNSTVTHVVGETVLGLSGGHIYQLIHDLAHGMTPVDHWIELPVAGFTPVEIEAGTNVVLVIDAAGSVRSLAGNNWGNYDYNSGLFTSLTATWAQTALTLPSGFQHLAVGATNDWFLYGSTETVARFVPNTVLNSEVALRGYDGSFDWSTSLGVARSFGNPSISIEPSTRVQYRFGCVEPDIAIGLVSFVGFIDWGDTRWKAQTMLDDGTIYFNPNLPARQCQIVPWCSNTSNPLAFKSPLFDFANPYANCSRYYTCQGHWIKVGSSYWGYGYQCIGPADSSRSSTCTTYP